MCEDLEPPRAVVRKGFWTDIGVVFQAILPDQRQVPSELSFVPVFPRSDLLLHRPDVHGFRDDYDSQVQEMRREGQSVDPLLSGFGAKTNLYRNRERSFS